MQWGVGEPSYGNRYTAPSDAALVADLMLLKSVGMNAVRKHQKVESRRWYYHADRLGLSVNAFFTQIRSISLPCGSFNLLDGAISPWEGLPCDMALPHR